jgi:hypothetical protein
MHPSASGDDTKIYSKPLRPLELVAEPLDKLGDRQNRSLSLSKRLDHFMPLDELGDRQNRSLSLSKRLDHFMPLDKLGDRQNRSLSLSKRPNHFMPFDKLRGPFKPVPELLDMLRDHLSKRTLLLNARGGRF